MKPIAYLRDLAARLFSRSRIASEMEEELRAHVAERADDLERTGIPRAGAERQARVELGGVEHYKEESFAVLGGNFFDTALQDVRLALRLLRKSPGFTIAAVLTLALAIGANAVVFSILNAFILRPLNVSNPQSLYGIWRVARNNMAQSYPDYLDLRDRNRTFENLVAYNVAETGFDMDGKQPTRSWLNETSGNYFDGLGLHPYLGRFFHASDERGPGSAPYIVLTYAFWHSRFQADPNVVGRVVRLNKQPYTIIGVGPEGFHGTLLFFNPDFFVPLVNHATFGSDDLHDRGDRWIFMSLGHLKPGVTQADAINDLNSIGSYLAATFPKDDAEMRTFTLARPSLYGDYVGKPIREFMTGLMTLAGLILLAACTNLGSLFSARATDRAREMALRLALGSSRKRILRGLLVEAVLISLMGGAVGLAGSVVLLQGLSAWQPITRWPLQLSVNPDARVYLVALLLAVGSGLLFGAVPVRQVLRTSPYEVVKSGSNGNSARRIGARDVLLVVQIAICGVLVTSSLVALRGMQRSLTDHFGFRVENTLLADADLSMSGYHDDQALPMQKRMIDAVVAIPGVESAAVADGFPMGDGGEDTPVFRDSTTDLKPANALARPGLYKISPGYFHASGTQMLAGRDFTWSDDKKATPVAIVNGEFARKTFGSVEGALGGHFKVPDGTRLLVIGVAEDGKYGSLTEDPQQTIFLPLAQNLTTASILIVHGDRDSTSLGTSIRAKLRGLDQGLPVFVESRAQGMQAMLFGPRMATIALGVLGMMGAMLSITGIFGVAASSVSKRRRELGIRVALGAKRREVLQTALGRAVRLLALGSAAGLLLGILASPVLAFVVSEATPRDPLVLACVVLAMALLGLIATWIPAQRALGLDPLVLLRED